MSSVTQADAQKAARARLFRLLGDVPGESNRRALMVRVVGAFVTAIVCSSWVGGGWAIAWLIAILLEELALHPWVAKNLLEPNLHARPRLAARTFILLCVFATALHGSLWLTTWFLAGEDFAFFGALIASGYIIHALTYLIHSRVVFFIAIAPAVFALAGAALLGPGPDAPRWLYVLMVGYLLISAAVAFRDRADIAKTMVGLAAARRHAEQSSRMKSQFLAVMTHELRTPLNAIIGFGEILREDLADNTSTANAADADRVLAAAHMLLAMVDDVLDFSHADGDAVVLDRQAVNIRELVEAASQASAELARAHANKTTLEIEENLVARVDAGRLRRCLQHVIANAHKFTRNGDVTIRAGWRDAVGELRLEVEDTGEGIAAEHLKRVFEPFERVDISKTRTQDGAGLGLAMTRKVLRLMSGDITCVSTPGKGSTFILRLAASAPDGSQASAAIA